MAEEASVVVSKGGLTTILINNSPFFYPISPMYNNILSAIITILYVKIVMEIGQYIRVKYGEPELSRKFVHLAAASFVVFWPLFDSSHWGWRLNVTVPVIMSLRLLYKVRVLCLTSRQIFMVVI